MTGQPHSQRETPGQTLRRERLRQGHPLQQVAEALNLDVQAVEAIEADRFPALGAQVYAKGHLRKYALLLGLDPVAILAGYHALQSSATLDPAAALPPARLPATAPGASTRTSVWLPLAILIIGFAALWYWKFAEQPPPVAIEAIGTSPEADVAASVSLPVQTTPQPSQSVTPQAEAPPADVVPASASNAATAPTPASPTMALTLSYTGDSWTEVYDVAGNKLMFDTGRPGQTRTLVGPAPLTVVLGAGTAVAASVSGRAIEIPLRANRDFAKFVVGADGVIQ